MGAIQGAVNQMIGSAAIAVAGAKHLKGQEQANKLKQTELAQKEAGEIAQAESVMTEAALRGSGFEENDIQAFRAAQALGLKEGSAQYKPQFSEMKRIYSEEVLGSETYAKMTQDAGFRARLLSFTSTERGRNALANALKSPELIEREQLLKGGNK